MTWSASQKSTIRIADYEEKREDLYYPYNEEIVNQALIEVGNSIGREITRNNLFYNKGRFFNSHPTSWQFFAKEVKNRVALG